MTDHENHRTRARVDAAASGPDRARLVDADASRSMAGCRFHLLLDSGRVLLHRVLRGRVFATDLGLAGYVVEDDTVGYLGARTGVVHPP